MTPPAPHTPAEREAAAARERVPPPTGPSKQPDATQARQGQNIIGMVRVLVISVLIVSALFAVFVAMSGGSDANEETSQPPAQETAAPPSAPT
jgi:hypothetical protein